MTKIPLYEHYYTLSESAMGNAVSLYSCVSGTGNDVVKAIRLKRKGTNEMVQWVKVLLSLPDN